MKHLIRRLSKVANSSARRSKASTDVPQGCLPVCVGEEMARYVVPAELLGQPAFVELLARSAQEYGYEQRGVLRIPCSVEVFERVVAGEEVDS